MQATVPVNKNKVQGLRGKHSTVWLRDMDSYQNIWGQNKQMLHTVAEERT